MSLLSKFRKGKPKMPDSMNAKSLAQSLQVIQRDKRPHFRLIATMLQRESPHVQQLCVKIIKLLSENPL